MTFAWHLAPPTSWDDGESRSSEAHGARQRPEILTASDQEIIQRIRAGDDAAVDALFTRCAARLAAYAYGFVRTQHVAEEIVQDVFLHLWEHRATWEVRGTVQAYLYSMVRGRALNVVKRYRLDERWRATPSDVVGPERPDQQLERDEEIVRLQRAVAQLPVRMRETLALRWNDGLSYAEIAAVMGISVRTVENQLAKGLRQLRIALGEEPA